MERSEQKGGKRPCPRPARRVPRRPPWMLKFCDFHNMILDDSWLARGCRAYLSMFTGPLGWVCSEMGLLQSIGLAVSHTDHLPSTESTTGVLRKSDCVG